jgi:ABC-2 type transport system permease protein
MKKILVIARKELISTFRQRNLIFVMILSPIVLVTIIALAFGGLGGAMTFAGIPVAVVNLDQGFRLPADRTAALGKFVPQYLGVKLPPGTRSGAELAFNFGGQLAAILLAQPLTATALISSPLLPGSSHSLSLNDLSCPLFPAAADPSASGAWSLDALLDAVALDDPAAARAGVAGGDFVAALIIPPDFSRRIVPSAPLTLTDPVTLTAAIEVVSNPATAISASIVRAVVESIAGQFERVSVAALALLWAIDDSRAAPASQGAARASGINLITRTLPTVDASVLEPVGCLLLPQVGAVQIRQQPVDRSQAQSTFGILMVISGGAQAVFFALFTGVFGINAIYEDRIQGTLQRLLVSPTPTSVILAGRLVGNLVIVMAQLLILLLAFTGITSLVEWHWRMIWGDNLPALLLVVLGLSLFTTGLGVLIVGLAKSSEQVQLIGPLITILLGAVSGSFGFTPSRAVAQLSPIWWGLDAMRLLASGESGIGLHLAALFAAGILFAGVGTFFFRRRMGL